MIKAETWDVMTYRDGMDQLDPTTLNTVLDLSLIHI